MRRSIERRNPRRPIEQRRRGENKNYYADRPTQVILNKITNIKEILESPLRILSPVFFKNIEDLIGLCNKIIINKRAGKNPFQEDGSLQPTILFESLSIRTSKERKEFFGKRVVKLEDIKNKIEALFKEIKNEIEKLEGNVKKSISYANQLLETDFQRLEKQILNSLLIEIGWVLKTIMRLRSQLNDIESLINNLLTSPSFSMFSKLLSQREYIDIDKNQREFFTNLRDYIQKELEEIKNLIIKKRETISKSLEELLDIINKISNEINKHHSP